MLFKEAFYIFTWSVKNYLNIIISCIPGLVQIFWCFLWINIIKFVPEPVHRVSQMFSPLLIPARVSARMASAIVFPSFYTVNTAPWWVVKDFDRISRRIICQVLTVICYPGMFVWFDVMQGIWKGHFPKTVMVAECLSIGCYVDDLRPVSLIVKSREQFIGKISPVFQQWSKGNLMGNRSVVKEQVYRPAGGQNTEIGSCGINFFSAYIMPSFWFIFFTYSFSLPLAKHSKLYPETDHDLKCLFIYRGFRQPHPFWKSLEPSLEVFYSPYYLGVFVFSVSEWHYHMVVCLRHCWTMTWKFSHA